MDSNSYMVFLVIGAALVVIDGQIIYRNGRRFLQQATPNAPAESLTKLVAMLFHLGTLGVLALLSTIDIPADNATKGVVLRLGIVLLVIGVAHWIAVASLSRIRDREEYEEVSSERDVRRQAHDQALRAQSAYGTDQPENPVYNGDSATSAVNRQYPQR